MPPELNTARLADQQSERIEDGVCLQCGECFLDCACRSGDALFQLERYAQAEADTERMGQ